MFGFLMTLNHLIQFPQTLGNSNSRYTDSTAVSLHAVKGFFSSSSPFLHKENPTVQAIGAHNQ